HLPPEGFNTLHAGRLLVEGSIYIYRGEDNRAWETVAQHWPAIASSGLMRLQFVRILLWELRGRCALAAAAGGPAPQPLIRAAERVASRLERERTPWSGAQAFLLRAGVAALQGEAAHAVSLLGQAVRGFDALHMALYAAAARRRHGELLGGG